MKKYIIGFIFFLIFNNAFSTVRNYTNYIYSNLNFSICYNHNYISNEDLLYYKGLSTLLNEYIIEKVDSQLLENKKVEIQIGCKLFGGHPEIEVSRNKNGYFVFIHHLPTLEYLVKIVDYFGSDSWSSFCYDIEKVDSEVAKKTFDKILNQNKITANLEFFRNKEVLVWEKNELKMIYKNDSILSFLNEKELKIKITDPYPTNIENRYFIVSKDSLFVYENHNVIQKCKINTELEDWDFEFEMKAYRKWMNFYEFDKIIISYSFEKNKFYHLRKKSNGR